MLIHPSHRVAARRRAGGRVATAQDRHRRGRSRIHLALGNVVVGPVVLDPAALPQGPQRRDHVVEALAPVVEVLAGLDVLLLAPPDPHPEADPVVGQHGGGAHRLRHGDEVAHRGDVDAGGEGDLVVTAGERRDQAHRVGPLGLLLPEGSAVGCGRVGVLRLEHPGVEEVVRQVDAVVAHLVRGEGQRPDGLEGQELDGLVEAHGSRLSGGGGSGRRPGRVRVGRSTGRSGARRGPTGRTPPGCA